MNYLYGKLNKELEYVKYSGEDTDTVNITVDNTDNTIKADVVRTPKTLTIHNNIYDSYDSFNGAYDTLIELPNYEIEQEDFPEGSLLIYDFKLNGEVISKIRIPYDKDIFNIELDVCVEDDKPLDGLHVGDPYLKITIEDGHGSSTYKYISLASLVYKAGDSIKIENNIISVDLDNGKLSDKLNSIEQNIAQTQSESNAHVGDKANPHQVTQQQVGIYTYKNIDASFEEGQGNESYPCAADIKLEAIKDDTQIPNIYFSKEQVDSGNYAPYCETYYKESNANTSVVSYKTGEKFYGWYADINSKPNWDLLDWDNAEVSDGFSYINLIEDPEATNAGPVGIITIMKRYGDYGNFHYDKGYFYIVAGGSSFIYISPPDSSGSGGGGVDPQYLVERNGWFQSNYFSSSYRTAGKLNYYDIWKHWIYASSNIIRTKEQLELKEDKWYVPCPWSYLPTLNENNPFFDQEKAESFKEHIKNNPDFFNNADLTFSNEGINSKFIRIFDITLLESISNITKGTYSIYFAWAEANPWIWTLYRSKVDNPTSMSDFASYDSTELEYVKVSNIKDGFQEALGDYIYEFDSNIQKLSDNDTVDELVFNTVKGFTTENGYSDDISLFSKLDWDNADGIKDPPISGSYERKVIDLFNINGKVFSAIADIPSSTSTGLPKKYYLAIGSGSTASANDDKFVYECSIRISSGYEIVSDYHWNIQTYAETTPLKINNIKHQDVWGLQIGKRAAITEAGYYLKAYSKEAGKITIPAITLQ